MTNKKEILLEQKYRIALQLKQYDRAEKYLRELKKEDLSKDERETLEEVDQGLLRSVRGK